MFRYFIASLIVVLSSPSVAHAQSVAADRSRTRAVWTVSGAGVGFGVGLWAGLTAFDDAVNSDRKVWTSAVVGAGIGAVMGYLIGRARDNHDRAPGATTAALTWRRETFDRRLLERLAQSITFSKATAAAASKGELEVRRLDDDSHGTAGRMQDPEE